MSKEKVCFVICPIGDEDSETRERSDLTYEYIIKPVVEEFGYRLTRADFIKESGMITSQIIDQIVESSLVIADLSDNNPNVFYELAIRHIVQKPYIQMIKSGQKVPFDITGMRTIYFDINLKSAHKAKKELKDQIESIKNDEFKPDNPITSAINYSIIHKMLTDRKEIDPDNISEVFLESISELRSMMSDIKGEIYSFKVSSSYPNPDKRINMKKEIFNVGNAIEELSHAIYLNYESLTETDDSDEEEKILYKIAGLEEQLHNLEIEKHYLKEIMRSRKLRKTDIS